MCIYPESGRLPMNKMHEGIITITQLPISYYRIQVGQTKMDKITWHYMYAISHNSLRLRILVNHMTLYFDYHSLILKDSDWIYLVC